MKKATQLAAVLALGTACAMPVLAQDTSASATNAAAPSTSQMNADSTTSSPNTTQMGAGPENTAGDDDRDLGWLGLLGLAGLLGLRRKHHDDHRTHRTTTAH